MLFKYADINECITIILEWLVNELIWKKTPKKTTVLFAYGSNVELVHSGAVNQVLVLFNPNLLVCCFEQSLIAFHLENSFVDLVINCFLQDRYG